MSSSDTSDDVDETITETDTEHSEQTSHEEQNRLNSQESTITPELETHDTSTVTYDESQINDCEPVFNSDENLSNNNPTDANNERSSSRRNGNGIEDFLASIEDDVPQITTNANANNQHYRYHPNEVQSIASTSSFRALRQNRGSFNTRYNENYSLVPSFIYNHPRSRELFDNLGVRLVQLPNNVEIHNNVLLNFNYNNEINNMIYVPESNIYRNAMLNALSDENILMEELYRANRRLNEIHDQQMLDRNNNEPGNVVVNVIEQMGPIDIIEVNPYNLLPMREVRIQHQPFQLPFEQLILIANGAISPLNGQYNALIHLIFSNPNLVFFNIRNIILIVHPDILAGENNAVFSQNHNWISVRELIRMNPVLFSSGGRNNNNGNQEFDREAGPSNE